MILDAQNLLSDAQAFSANAATTNSIYIGNSTPVSDIGMGEPMAMVIDIDVAADFTSGNETYAFSIIQSANADLSSPDTLVSRTILYSVLTLGAQVVIPIPPNVITKTYIGGYFTGGGTTPTVTATIAVQPVSMIQNYKSYAKNYTVSV